MIGRSRWMTGLMLACALALSGNAYAQDQDDNFAQIRKLLDAYRTDLNTAKEATFRDVLKLSDEEGAKFWPIYKEYEGKVVKLGDERVRFANDFAQAQSAATFDQKTAGSLSKRWFKLQEDRLRLLRTYHDKIARAVSPVRAAQFAQLEHEINLFVDLNLYNKAPLIGQH